jgi:FtsH-binding integral membrane protein
MQPTTRSIDFRAVMKLVYIWMGLGMLISAAVAWMTLNTAPLIQLRTNPAVVIIAIIAQLGLVIALNIGIARKSMSPNAAALMFFAYSALTGFTLSIILLVYEIGTITNALVTTVALFAIMSVFGYTTKMDLTRWGTYLMFGVIGLLVAMIVNLFLGSSMIDFIISVFGVVIFTALTAHDTQKIREMSESYEIQGDGNLAVKLSIIGALTLYLDFVNLFLFILRLLGGGGRD